MVLTIKIAKNQTIRKEKLSHGPRFHLGRGSYNQQSLRWTHTQKRRNLAIYGLRSLLDKRYGIEDTLIRKKTDEWLLSESHQILVPLTKCNIFGAIFPLGSSEALISQHYTD